jgi:hypothetical protein
MKPPKIALAIFVLFASSALSDDFKTINGKEYTDATVSRIEPDGIVVKTKSGVSKVYFSELPKEVRERFHYVDSASGEAVRPVIDKDQAKEMEAAAKIQGQFQTAELRVQHAYQRSEKGTLTGQVFIATKGAENMKLGAVSVSLFDGDAIDNLLGGLSAFASAKSRQLQLDIVRAQTMEQQAATALERAQAAKEEAEAKAEKSHELFRRGLPLSDGARMQVDADKQALSEAKEILDSARSTALGASAERRSLLAMQAYYHSPSFYFSYLSYPIQTAETDAEGRFVLQLPLTGGFVIAAQAGRSAGTQWESYYWLQPVSLNGQQQGVQNLSNSNVMLIPGAN